MQSLSKGANAPLPPGPVTVAVQCTSAVDVSALLVTAAGRVRSDDDMVFYNQPVGPGVSWASSGVTITPAQVPAEIDKVVVTASLDSGGPFRGAGVVTARISDGSGAELAQFPITDLGPESALICVEVYRRNAEWKVRAVGQGYANGLAGIATDFGITVDDAPPPMPAPLPAMPAQPVSPSSRPAPAGGWPPPTGRPVNLAPPVSANRIGGGPAR